MTFRFVFILSLLLICLGQEAWPQSISRVEPANWWIGMQHSSIQLLVYGENISKLSPSIMHEDVRLERVIRVENPNYLFLYLNISEAAAPGKVPLNFYEGKRLKETFQFELLPREPGRKNLQGFNSADAMYLITPDRFANGNPENDEVAGMKEGLNRSFKGGRHGGDIQGILDHLDYIADLGFTAVWINPVLENDMPTYSYHGYAATDFYQVDRRFGSNEEYRVLCEAARKKGIKVIMDMIVNHSGSEHWFVKDPPAADWLNKQEEFAQTTHMRYVNQDPYASEYDKQAFSDGWFVRTMPDLNQRNELMADYLIQNTLWWIEYAGISGIRMDTYPYPDKNFMSRWTCAVMEEYPDFSIVGEEWSLNPATVAYWQRGKDNHDDYASCLPSLMDFPLQHAISSALQEEENWNSGLIKAYEMLSSDYLYADPFELVIFPDNHDMNRFFTQVKHDTALFKMGMVYFASMRGIPQLYYGTETLMENAQDPGDHGVIRTDFPGGWEGDEVNAFSGEGLEASQREAQKLVTKLFNWRKKQPVIHHGELRQFAPENGVYSYIRYLEEAKVLVILNKNEEETVIDFAKYDELLKGYREAQDVLTDARIDLSQPLKMAGKSALLLEMTAADR